MPSLVLNVAPVLLSSDARVRVTQLPFVSKDQLKELRRDRARDVVFRRRGDIVDAAYLDESPEELPGGPTEERDLHEDPYLATNLIERALIDRLAGLKRTILGVDPIEFLSERESDDVVRATGVALPPWLKIRLGYELHVRVRHPAERSREITIVVDAHVRHDIDTPIRELRRLGVDVRGLYAAEDRSLPTDSFRRRSLVGQIDAYEGDDLLLVDHREGRDRIRAGEAFLEPRLEATERIVERLIGDRAGDTLAAIQRAAMQLVEAETRHARIYNTLLFLGREPLVIAPGVSARIDILRSHRSRNFWPTRSASRVTYVFDPRGVKLHDRNAEGLENYGPYSSRTSFNPSPRICVIAEASQQGAVEKFLFKLFEGAEDTVHSRGLRGLFAMEPKQPTFFVTKDGSATAYRRAAQKAIEAAANDGNAWDLAIVQVREETKTMFGDENPYLVAKASFLNHQIPVQEFRIETTRQPEGSLGYTLRNLALACRRSLASAAG